MCEHYAVESIERRLAGIQRLLAEINKQVQGDVHKRARAVGGSINDAMRKARRG